MTRNVHPVKVRLICS